MINDACTETCEGGEAQKKPISFASKNSHRMFNPTSSETAARCIAVITYNVPSERVIEPGMNSG